jgi:hypothetical protein
MSELNLQALLEEGLTGTQVLQRLREAAMSAAPVDVWQRLALLVRFDATLYAAATRDLAPVSPFEAIASSPEVSRIDGESGMFAVTPARRKELFDPSRANLDALRLFAATMRSELDARGRGFDLDAFAVALVANPDDGAERFKELYQAADARLEIPRCSQILEILRARQSLVPGLTELSFKYDDYFRARTMFVEDLYRSASYLDRPPLRKAFERFWASSDKWVLRLYGKGGRGKTMFVRWLIARRCLPWGQRRPPIAVARVDFDELSLTAFDDHPWLVLLPIMRQLSPQLPNRPFQTLIRDLEQYSAYLRTAAHERDVSASLQGMKANTLKQFRAGLSAEPVLLIFDTCEEPLIHRHAAFVQLLEMLGEARARDCPRLRLLLSGRYDVETKGLTAFQDVSERIEVTPFDDTEAKAYLTKYRRMKAGALVNAIVAKSDGNPFKLGLFADLAASPEGLSLEEVREAPRAEFVYLLDRVILRIPQEPVRWLVRYAAIPRELTLEFASQVIAPLLRGRSRDQANQFATDAIAKRYASRPPWPKANLTDMTQVWADLRAYASNPSWILWDDDAKSLKLQGEVVGPLRQLLQENRPFYDALQRRAESYWRRRGRANRASYTAAVAEEFFHKFHRIGPAAGRDWRKAFDDPRLADTSGRLRLAEVVLDLLDERGMSSRQALARPMVDPSTVLRARAEVALAALAARLKLGRMSGSDAKTYTQKLTEQWQVIARTPRSRVRGVITRGELTLLRTAYSYLRLGRQPSIAPLRALSLPPRLRLLARMLAGRLSYERYFLGRSTDGRDFDAARALSTTLRSEDFPAHHIWFRAGMLHLRTANLPKAAEAFRTAWRTTPRSPMWREEAIEAFWRLVAVLRMMGKWTEALQVLDAVQSSAQLDASPFLFNLWHARATIFMDHGDVLKARQALEEARLRTESPWLEAVWHELAAEVALRAYDLPAADAAIQTARELYSIGGLGHERMEILEASALIVAGNRRAARLRLRRRPPYYWPLWLEESEARIRAGVIVSPLLYARGRKIGAAVVRARALAAALAHGRVKDPKRLWEELKGLDDEARFAALQPFEETDGTFAFPEPSRGVKLDRVLPAAPADDSAVSFLQRLALANALRFFGRHRQALDVLRGTRPAREPTIEWRRLRAFAAAGVFDASTPTVLAALHDHVSAVPYFVAVASLEALEWALRHGQLGAARQIGELASTMRAVTGRIGSGWAARLALAEGELHAAHGEWDDAAGLLRTAQSTAKAAGNLDVARRATTGLRALTTHTTAPRATVQTQLVPAVDEWRLTRSGTAEVAVEARLVSGAGFKHRHRVSSGLNYLVEPGLDPLAAVRSLAALDRRIEERLSKKVRLRVEPGFLAALPWEELGPADVELFYRSGLEDAALDETRRWMQLALKAAGYDVPLTSDVADPVFQKALATVIREHGTPLHETLRTMATRARAGQSPVVVSEPDVEWQYGNRRGYAPRNVNLASAYSEFFVEDLAKYSMVSSPSVVHLAGVFNDPITGAQKMDLVPGDGSIRTDRPGQWSAHDFRAFAADIPGHRAKPLFVVDALSTGSVVDAMQEGLRRNTLCADVFEQGGARAVLGFGLAKPGQERECLEILVSAIRENVSIGRLHARLLAAGNRFSFPPALWCDDPHLPADIDL